MKNKEKPIVEKIDEERVGKMPNKFIDLIKRHKKILIPSFILILLLLGIVGTKMKDGSFFASPYGENYAFKDLTGHNSRYLIPWESESYIVDIDLKEGPSTSEKEEGQKNPSAEEENPGQSEGENPSDAENKKDPLDKNDEESDKDKDDDYWMGHEPNENSPNSGSSRLRAEDREGSNLASISSDLFNSIEISNDTWNVEKAIEVTEENYITKQDAEQLKTAVARLVNGNFGWDYRNQDNKLDYLAFRVGEYIYDNRLSSVPLIYDRMHEKAVQSKTIITPSYNEKDVKIYIHPHIGGYVIDVPLTLTINENGKETVKTMRYLPQMVFRTPSPIDIWELWTTREDGVMMIGEEYSIKDTKEVRNNEN